MEYGKDPKNTNHFVEFASRQAVFCGIEMGSARNPIWESQSLLLTEPLRSAWTGARADG
jgi:hypothetical protein